MAKAKKNTGNVDLELDALDKELGIETLSKSNHGKILDVLPTFIPRVDAILGGGLPFGRIIEIAGSPGAGKSTFTHHISKVGTALDCVVILLDVEGTTDDTRLRKLGVDTDKVKVVRGDGDINSNMTVEKIGNTVLSIVEKYNKKQPDKRIIFIWDSVGETGAQAEIDRKFGEKEVGLRAAAIKQFLLKCREPMQKANAMFIGINQVRDDIGGNPMFPILKVPGGKQWEHAATLRLELKNRGQEKRRINGKDVKVGHKAGIVTRKSKVSMPFQEAPALMLSETGFDYEENLVLHGADVDMVSVVNGGSKGQSYEYIVQSTGEKVKMAKPEFIEWLKNDKNGREVRQELLERLIVEEFPNYFSPLSNEIIDVSKWADGVNIPHLYKDAEPEKMEAGGFGTDYTDAELEQMAKEQNAEKY